MTAKSGTAGRSWKPPSTLPPLYAGWIDDLLDGPLPLESEATCENCAMWPSVGSPGAATLAFHRETKCCTYIPALANFLVGRIVEDDDPALAPGRASFEARIDARLGVTPLGIDRPAVHTLLYHVGVSAAFGRSRTLRCPLPGRRRGRVRDLAPPQRGLQHVVLQAFARRDRPALLAWARAAAGDRGARAGALVSAPSRPRFRRARPAAPAGDRPRLGGNPTLDGATIDGRVDDATYRAWWGSRILADP